MANRKQWLRRLLPMRRWWPLVGKATVKADLVAGFTGTVILVPQAVAYASIAGLPPQYGLYTAIVPVIVSSLFGSSWHLVSGPTAAISIVVFSTLSPLAEPGSASYVQLAFTLTFLTGALMLAMGLARLGVLVNFISHGVVVGFTAGAALLIAGGQLKHFFGLPLPAGTPFVDSMLAFVRELPLTNPYVLSTGVVTLAAGIATRRALPRVPHLIGAMLAGSLWAALLRALFGDDTGVAMVAAVPRRLPPLSAPDLSWETIRELGAVALALAMLCLTEAIAIARSIALKSGQRIDSSQEFIGQGLANLCGAFASAYASSGSFTRSGVNFAAGARTPLAPVFSAVFLALVLIAFAPLVRWLPIASMAAVLLMVAWSLVDAHHIRSIVRTSRTEAAVLAATFLSTLFLHLEFAIYVGVLLSLMAFLERTARPAVRDAVPASGEGSYHFVPQTDEASCCQLRMVFLDGALYFGAVDHVQRHFGDDLASAHPRRHLLLLAPGINFIDSAGAELLAREARRRRQEGGALYFHRLQPSAVQVLERAGHLSEIGTENLFAIGRNVIDEIYPRLDSEICRSCPTRIFRQCRHVLPNGEPRTDEPAVESAVEPAGTHPGMPSASA